MINFNENDKRWTLKNDTFIYQIGLKNNMCHHICFLPARFAGDVDHDSIMARELQPEAEIQINNEARGIHTGTRWNGCAASRRATYQKCEISDNGGSQSLVITSLVEDTGLEIENHYIIYDDSSILTRFTVLSNKSGKPVNIQHLGSFAIYGMPFFTDGIPGKDIMIHSFPASWQWEGQYKTITAEEAGLFSKHSLASWRVENTGSWSSKEYIPFFIIEQKSKKICWAAQIEHSGSWRFELGGFGMGEGPLYMQGGLGNHMYAHWSKMLAPGETFESAKVSLACVSGEIDDAMNLFQEHRAHRQIRRSSGDSGLPVIFNEWLSTQGAVREETIRKHMAALENSGVEVYTIDAGWFMEYNEPGVQGAKGDWFTLAGDWEAHPSRFPEGLGPIADMIKTAGMIPGIWAEIEVAGNDSIAYTQNTGLFMKNETGLVETSTRRFLYFGNPETRRFADNVFEKLIADGFGYFKIDYNVDCGLGCINSGDSLGQGLVENIRGYYRWLDDLRSRHPDIIIENCSSGGNRLDYGMLSRSDLASVTDQSDLFRLGPIFYGTSGCIHPSQMGMWSVVKEELSEREIVLSLINSMMGRMHISGFIEQLSEEKKHIVLDAIAFYKKWREMLNDVRVYHHTPYASLQNPEGWLVLQICGHDSGRMLLGAWRLKSDIAEFNVDLKEIDPDADYTITTFSGNGEKTSKGIDLANDFKISLNEETSAILFGIEKK
ncbi:MAG: glycoside hydrolase family 36 protein [Saccharofermentanales bacterium]